MGKNLLLWLIIAAVLLTVFNNFSVRPQPQEITYSSFISEVQQDQVHEVAINGLVIIGKRKSGEDFKVVRPPIEDPKLMDELINHNVNVIGEAPEQQSIWAQLLIASFPILIIIAVFMLFMRQMQGGAGGRGGPMAFGKSKAACCPKTRSRPRSPTLRVSTKRRKTYRSWSTSYATPASSRNSADAFRAAY
jgi:cell division protease FtsH